MLKSIMCDKFVQPVINFNNKLNTIVGTEDGANSIGKTMLLDIINFCYGDNSYLKTIMSHVENHTIYFTFDFREKTHYYARSTALKERCHIFECDSSYNPIKRLHISEYAEIIKNKIKSSYKMKVDEKEAILAKKIFDACQEYEHRISSGENAIYLMLSKYLRILRSLKPVCYDAHIHNLIDNHNLDYILKLLSKSTHQIFLVIDRLRLRGEFTQKLVNKNKVIQLSSDRPLFKGGLTHETRIS